MNNCDLIAQNVHINYQYASKTVMGQINQLVSYRYIVFVHSNQNSNGLKFNSETNYRYTN